MLILLSGIVGNGIGAWNIRTISSGRILATACLTFVAATINMSALREIARDVHGIYVLAWSIGSTVGIVLTTYLDKRWFGVCK
jgi:hypothetical protein